MTGRPRDGRFNSSMILGKMRTRTVPAVPVLMPALQDQVREVRCQTVFVLGQIGPETKKEPEPKARAGIHRPERLPREASLSSLAEQLQDRLARGDRAPPTWVWVLSGTPRA